MQNKRDMCNIITNNRIAQREREIALRVKGGRKRESK